MAKVIVTTGTYNARRLTGIVRSISFFLLIVNLLTLQFNHKSFYMKSLWQPQELLRCLSFISQFIIYLFTYLLGKQIQICSRGSNIAGMTRLKFAQKFIRRPCYISVFTATVYNIIHYKTSATCK